MKNSYIPKQFFQMFNQEEMDGNKVIWKQVDPYHLSLSFCCYYHGGQWRHITINCDLRSMFYNFSSVFYPNGSKVDEGHEILKSEWKSLGYSIQNDGVSLCEVIPMHDIQTLDWLVKKNVLHETSDPKYASAGVKIARFLAHIRVYSQLAQNSETYQAELNNTIENLGIMKNVNMIKDMLIRHPNEKIWIPDNHNLQDLYSVCSIKHPRQVNPEHIYQITKPFFGEFNVDSE